MIVVIAIALVLAVLAFKFLKGIVKLGLIAVIVIVAGYFLMNFQVRG